VIEAVANGGAAGLPFVVSTLIADSPQTTNSPPLPLSVSAPRPQHARWRAETRLPSNGSLSRDAVIILSSPSGTQLF